MIHSLHAGQTLGLQATPASRCWPAVRVTQRCGCTTWPAGHAACSATTAAGSRSSSRSRATPTCCSVAARTAQVTRLLLLLRVMWICTCKAAAIVFVLFCTGKRFGQQQERLKSNHQATCWSALCMISCTAQQPQLRLTAVVCISCLPLLCCSAPAGCAGGGRCAAAAAAAGAQRREAGDQLHQQPLVRRQQQQEQQRGAGGLGLQYKCRKVAAELEAGDQPHQQPVVRRQQQQRGTGCIGLAVETPAVETQKSYSRT